MAQPNYLAGADLAAFGVPAATAQQIQQASTLVDGYLKRPEGLIYGTDHAGMPAFMAGINPTSSATATSAVNAGLNVIVPFAGAYVTQDMIGDVVLLDRSGQAEACVIVAMASGTLTLAVVTASHAAGCTIEFGVVIAEERQLPAKCPITRVAQMPVARIIAGSGRYAYGRRSQQSLGFEQEFNLLADLSTLGGPPLWIPFDVSQLSMSSVGDVWVPPGLYMAVYTEVRLRYVAGWTYANLPAAIKQATANIVAALSSGLVATQLRKYTVGPLSSERFNSSQIDADTAAMLEPFKARIMF